MARSKWKIPYVNLFILDLIRNRLKNSNKDKVIYTDKRDSVILKEFVGWTFYIYKGNKYSKVLISKDMIGYKLGMFSFTRSIGRIHKLQKKKK